MDFFNSQVITFITVTLVLTVTPGVDTFIVMRNVLRGGKADGIITALGICSGLFVHAGLSALGISILLVHSALFFTCIKALGALYLIWLGVLSIYDALKNDTAANVDSSAAGCRKIRAGKSFQEGFFSNLFNPKPAIFYLAFLPQFISASDPVLIKSMVLALIQFIIGIAWLSIIAYTISKTRDLIEKPRINRLLKTASGLILVTLGFKIGLESQ